MQESNIHLAADSHEIAASNRSIFDSIGDVVTKGIPLTGLSIYNSFVNTGVDVANFFGADVVRNAPEVQLLDEDLLQYYREKKDAIEVAGLITGSVIPGTIALKALNVFQAGKFGTAMQRATNIMRGPKEEIINEAKDAIVKGSVYSGIQQDKWRAIGYGFGEQAIQAAAWEVATIATMKANPTIDRDDMWDIANHMFWGTLVGGGVGGVIEGIGIRATLNKFLLDKDVGEKAFDIVKVLGKGNFNTGDRVVMLLKGIDDMPPPETATATAKAARTRAHAEIEILKQLKTMSPDMDENLGKAMIDTLYKMRHESGLSKEEMYEYFARLQRVSRINQFSATEAENVRYLNSFIPSEKTKGFTLDRLFTAAPDEAADVSLAVRIKSQNRPVKVGLFDDGVRTEGGLPKYSSKKEAFESGADIFVDSKLRIRLNPASETLERTARPGESKVLTEAEERVFRKTGQIGATTESEKLLGAPMYFNVLTGEVKSRSWAVVGDIAPIVRGQEKKLLAYDADGRLTGLKIGETVSPQTLESGFAYRTLSTLDANARYVWAHLRGIQKNDIINFDDLPMLQRALRTVQGDRMDKLRELNVRIRNEHGEVEQLPLDVFRFRNDVQKHTDDVIAELLGDGSKAVDADAVAIKANISRKYLEDGLKTQDFANSTMRPIEDSMRVNTVRLDYDIGDLTVHEGHIARGLIDVQNRIATATDQAWTAAVNFFGKEADLFKISRPASEANIFGAGSSAFGFAAGGYNTLAQEVERVGAVVMRLLQKRRSAITDRFNADSASLLADEAAGAELGAVLNIGRRIARQYTFLPPEVAAAFKVSPDTMVLEDSVRRNAQGVITTWEKNYVPHEGNWISGRKFGEASKEGKYGEGAYTYYELNTKVANFLRMNGELNDARLIDANNFTAAVGSGRQFKPGIVYFPPVDTTKYRYVAIVREPEGKGWGTSDAAAIVADSQANLDKKVALLGADFRITFKGTSRDYHQALGDYDYGMNFVESAVDAALKKKGVLSDYFVKLRSNDVVKEFLDWNIRQEERLVRNYVELGNAQLFAELNAMGKKFRETAERVGGAEEQVKVQQIRDPFRQYIKTALNISEKQEYRLWQEAQEVTEAFFASAHRAAQEVLGKASKGVISFEEANAITQRLGLGNPYERTLNAVEAFKEANKLPLQPVLSRFVQKANAILGAVALRLDAFQTLINVVSTPVLQAAVYASAKNDPALRRLLTTELPDGTSRAIPAYTKVLFQAMGDMHGASKQAILERAERLAVISKTPRDYYELLDQLTLTGGETASKLEKAGNRAVELGVKLTGSDWAEQFTRLTSFRVSELLFEAMGYTGKQLDDNIRTFVNRVHGNYIAAQRPIAFQGPMGQAMGLFQTYQFNLMQQLFRFVENKEKLPTALLFGIQGTLFGAQGLPGFHMLNTHIVGNAADNPSHMDFYSEVPTYFDRKLGNYLLYGSLSGIMQTGLYSRGDINPRQLTILPVNPLDYPSVSAGIRFVSNMLNMAEKLKDGGKFSDSIMQAIEHQGVSRPLMGITQVVQGYTTTSKGSLISASNDWFSITSAMRMLGGRPLDEAITLDAMYRSTAYKAKDRARIAQLGEAVKSNLIAGGVPTGEQIESFAGNYASQGGRIENFGRKMVEWTKDANTSQANEIFRSLASPLNQNMMKIMGGEQLPDFTNQIPRTSRP